MCKIYHSKRYPNGLSNAHRIVAPIRMGTNNATNAMCVSQVAWYFTLVFNGLKQLAQRIPDENSTEAGTKIGENPKIQTISISSKTIWITLFNEFAEFTRYYFYSLEILRSGRCSLIEIFVCPSATESRLLIASSHIVNEFCGLIETALYWIPKMKFKRTVSQKYWPIGMKQPK